MMLEGKCTLSPYVLSTVPQQQWFSGICMCSCERAYCWDCCPYTTPLLPVERLEEQWILGYWTEQVEGVCVSVCTCSTSGPCRAQSNSSMWFLRSKQWIDFVILATTENLLTARNKPGIKACFPALVFNIIITTSTENACNNDTAATAIQDNLHYLRRENCSVLLNTEAKNLLYWSQQLWLSAGSQKSTCLHWVQVQWVLKVIKIQTLMEKERKPWFRTKNWQTFLIATAVSGFACEVIDEENGRMWVKKLS